VLFPLVQRGIELTLLFNPRATDADQAIVPVECLAASSKQQDKTLHNAKMFSTTERELIIDNNTLQSLMLYCSMLRYWELDRFNLKGEFELLFGARPRTNAMFCNEYD